MERRHCIMANKKNSKKNSKKKNAPEVKEIKEQKIQEQAAEVIEEAKSVAAPEVTEVVEPVEEAAPEVEVPESAAEEAAPEEVILAAEPEAIEPVSEAAEPVAAPEEVIEVSEPEVVEEAAPEEVSDEATKDTVVLEPAEVTEEAAEVIEKAEPVAAPEEVTDFTLVMDPVDSKNGAQTAAPQVDSNFVDAGQDHSTAEERIAAEYAAARSEGPAASTAITPVIPVTGYGTGSDTVEFEAPKAHKERKLKGVFDKPVTRKFLAGALGLTLVLNGLIAAGIMGLFANDLEDDISEVKKSVNELEENSGNMGGGPGMGMTPPDWNSGNGGYEDDWNNGNGNGFYDREDSDSGNYWDDDDWDYDDRNDDDWAGQQNGDQNNQQIGGQQSQQNSSKVSIGIVISDNNGVYISQVTGSNAQKAGFKEGDKIVEFDGEDIDNSNELIEEVQEHKAGDKVTVVVERNGKQQKIKTTLE